MLLRRVSGNVARLNFTEWTSIVTQDEFERLLDAASTELTVKVRESDAFHGSTAFADLTRQVLGRLVAKYGIELDHHPHPHVFPDIPIEEFGVEVKVTDRDGWRTVANSVFEGTRSERVKHIYVMFGKMGGVPEVRWAPYGESVVHVRTSHVPRFEIEIGAKESLFAGLGISYGEFAAKSDAEKMGYVRKYTRARLRPGERLWWLDDTSDPVHSLPLEVRLYQQLAQPEKRMLRAEATLLCPQVVGGSRKRKKYNDAAIFLLTYHGVLCPQTRDLFSAGSVGDKSNSRPGKHYIKHAIRDIESEMRDAAIRLEDGLFVEYWEESVPPAKRIKRWLELADNFASGWKPSKFLFRAKSPH